MKQNLIYILTLLLMISCTPKKEVQGITDSSIRHASLLQMQYFEDGITLCIIANPWKQDETAAQYLLVPSNNDGFGEKEIKIITEKYGESEIIRTPLERMTITASCHGYLLEQIGALKNVAVFCDPEYVMYSPVRQLIDNNTIVNGGTSMAPNIETILSKESDAIWISPFENASAGNISTLQIPIIYCADYMETSPLGRAEWMKFYGRLVNKTQEADSLFCLVESRYDSIKNSFQKNNIAKTTNILLSELPYQSTWYIPGGKSTMGILYHDAGYKYPWADDEHSGSLALSAETVLSIAQNADVWVFKYLSDHDYTLSELLQQNPYYGQFKATQEGNVYGCNTQSSDFYDVTPFRPDIMLEELKNIENDSTRYFKRLK